MIRKKMIALLKRGACISLAAAVLSATAVPAAGAVYAKGNGSETTVSEEGTIPEKENGETQKKDDTKQNEETESGGEEEKTGSEKSEADSVKQSEQISGSNVVTEKISQTPQVQQTEIFPEQFYLNKTSQSLVQGATFQLATNGFSGNATNKEVVWSTSDPAVVTVNENGLVTAVGEGTAVVTATSVGKNADMDIPVSAQCTVRVLNKEGAYVYSTNETGVTIEQYTGAAMMITVPDEIGGRPVTAVAAGAFSNGNYIGDLTLPDTITSVSKNSFDDVSHLVAAKNTDTAKALEEAGFKYLAKVTVTFTTEFYNRDGSLSDTKGGTSIYTRREGNNLNMSTATYNRGWVLESETVTGMTDTNDALNKVEGTVGEEDITIKYVWREDNLGPDGEADKIPDQYQMDVTFSVVNGTWDDGLAETLDKFVTIRDENGNPAAEGSIEADLPGVGNAPAEGYEAGSWSPDVTSNLTFADEGTNFIYAYAEKQEVVDPDPEKPDEDKPGTDKPGIDKPDEDTDKIKENKKERTDSRKSNGEVQTSDTSPVGAAAGLLLLSGGVIIGVEELRRRKND